ncbi:phosphoribosyltransferase family protein [Allobranchiibius sp. GilTou38]|uniref:ComF family protein n=1 Tax=Allobranchiibius sp. GilTou38 TaxID=2815210 RepID=UPI001AA11C4A|nr:phosphoribosyltransferase family protein [Allobranchiibius sp. GilTou38]MBO1765670.1 ComF family protein [Allobranchiibius sp. GilTou38]
MRWVEELLDLVAPRRCAGCDAAGARVCGRCAGDLSAALEPVSIRVRPSPEPEGFPPTWAQGIYAGVLAQVLRCYKDDDRPDLVQCCAPFVRGALYGCLQEDSAVRDAMLAGTLAVTIVPSSARALRTRGRDPLWDLVTRALARHDGVLPRPVRLLRVTRRTRDQAGLDATARADNLSGAMRVRDDVGPLVDGRVVVVFDDIVTTGSTLVEAARALRSAGASHVVACTIAATPRAGYRQGMERTVGTLRAAALPRPSSRGGDPSA